jgi:hypothetical protein
MCVAGSRISLTCANGQGWQIAILQLLLIIIQQEAPYLGQSAFHNTGYRQIQSSDDLSEWAEDCVCYYKTF